MLKAKVAALLTALVILVASTGFAEEMTLSSPTIEPGATLSTEQVFNGFGCTGTNVSPALEWTKGPEGTLSYALTVYDPDAPTGSGWWHWLLYNIPSDVTSLAAGAGDVSGAALPAGAAQGRSDYGYNGFGGACPPEGDKPHRYVFTIHALKVDKFDLPKDATAALIGFMINANTLEKASFTAYYGR